MNIIQVMEKEQAERLEAKRPIPEFAPGDTLRVNVKVIEGERTRVQAYEGVCIARSGGGINDARNLPEIGFHTPETSCGKAGCLVSHLFTP